MPGPEEAEPDISSVQDPTFRSAPDPRGAARRSGRYGLDSIRRWSGREHLLGREDVNRHSRSRPRSRWPASPRRPTESVDRFEAALPVR